MTSLSKKEFNKDIEKKVDDINGMRKIAKRITLTEFIEQYTYRFDHVSLGAMWYAVNQDDISYEEAIKYVAGTD